MDCQDWETVTIRKKNTQKPANARKPSSGLVAHARKLESEHVVLKKLSKESRQEIMARRVTANMTQVQLNQVCQFPIHTINKIESGHQEPTLGQLQTLNRVLKTGLKYETTV